jgi:microcystin-dependent protein
VGTPGINFTGDTNSGIYHIGPDNIGVSAAGAKVLDIATTGLTVTGIVDATVVKQGTYRLVPAGALMPYAGSSAPDGWLLCYGQEVNRTTYADLFTAISTTYGEGDASTTFNLPDLRGRVIAGQDDMGGVSADRLTDQSGGLDGDTLGDTGGAETHTLVQDELAGHTHTGTTGTESATHTHTENTAIVSATSNAQSGANFAAVTAVTNSGLNTGNQSANHTHTFTSAGTGSDDPHNNVQPTIILNYIIKT